MSVFTQPSPAPTPQQQLASEVSVIQAEGDKLLSAVVAYRQKVANHFYANQINNGTPDQTFGPQDVANAWGDKTILLCQSGGAMTDWLTAQNAITVQHGGSPVSLVAIPPAGITITPNSDGKTATITGQTPLQIAQAALITARQTLAAAQTSLAAVQAVVMPLQEAITAANAKLQTDNATLSATQSAIVNAGENVTKEQHDASLAAQAAVDAGKLAITQADASLNQPAEGQTVSPAQSLTNAEQAVSTAEQGLRVALAAAQANA